MTHTKFALLSATETLATAAASSTIASLLTAASTPTAALLTAVSTASARQHEPAHRSMTRRRKRETLAARATSIVTESKSVRDLTAARPLKAPRFPEFAYAEPHSSDFPYRFGWPIRVPLIV